MKNNKVVKQEKVLLNVGRMRNVQQGRDGYLYIGVESPGIVFRLRPQ
jgi:glucose/arabinose dehydrogenase